MMKKCSKRKSRPGIMMYCGMPDSVMSRPRRTVLNSGNRSAMTQSRSERSAKKKGGFSLPSFGMKKKSGPPPSSKLCSSDTFEDEVYGARDQSCSLQLDCEYEDEGRKPLQQRDPLLQLVSLQKASGCWELEPALAKAVGKTSQDLENKQPSAEKKEVWATILALVWLHGLKADAQDEWELLAMKAVAWLRSQNASGLAECVEAANALLGCSVQKETLGL